MPNTIDRLQDGTAAAILFEKTSHLFHTSQTMLNHFREPQKAVIDVQLALEQANPTIALFLDLSKAFERVNAFWLLRILHIRRAPCWVVALARRLLFGRKILHKVPGRLLPPRLVKSGVDMGRSTSVYFFCLAMDPIFTMLNQIPGVIAIAGYVDDTTIIGKLDGDLHWIRACFRLINQWRTAGIVMDQHTCWKVGTPGSPDIPLAQLLPCAGYRDNLFAQNPEGRATFHEAVFAAELGKSAIVARGPHFVHLSLAEIRSALLQGSSWLIQLAQGGCECKSKMAVLVNANLSPPTCLILDQNGLGLQAVAPSTVNLGLGVSSGWAFNGRVMAHTEAPHTWATDLAKQIAKFELRIKSATVAHLSIHKRIIYFNAFCLSLFNYGGSWRCYPQEQLRPLYQTMLSFILQRKWFPALLLPGVCRYLRIGPLLDPSHMQATSSIGLLHRRGLTLCQTERISWQERDPQARAALQQWEIAQKTLTGEQRGRLYNLERAYVAASWPSSASRLGQKFKQLHTKFQVEFLQRQARTHLENRIHTSGWPDGPQPAYLEWLSTLPLALIAHIPRYSILRWALTEDSDVWLPVRGILSREAPCVICLQPARRFPLGSQCGAICDTCIPNHIDFTPIMMTEAEKTGYTRLFGRNIPEFPSLLSHIVDRIQNVAREVPESHMIPCVLCQAGYNSIDHWVRFCPVLTCAVNALLPKQQEWVFPDYRHPCPRDQGIICTLALFHVRRHARNRGGMQNDLSKMSAPAPIIKIISEVVADIYQSLPSVVLNKTPSPPVFSASECVQASLLEVKQIPSVHMLRAVLPKAGLMVTQPVEHNAVIAVLHPSDSRIKFLISQQPHLTIPHSKVELCPIQCACGKMHLQVKAVGPVLPDTFLMIGPEAPSRTLLVQFDGSSHRGLGKGGAGVVSLEITPGSTTVLDWLSLALPDCKDNVEAEAVACQEALQKAATHATKAREIGDPYDAVIVQGDILPILNYLNNRGRMRTPKLIDTLLKCRDILSSYYPAFVLRYLPRECNKLADYFAGQGSKFALEPLIASPVDIPAHIPYALLQRLGFTIKFCPMEGGHHYCLTETPEWQDGLYEKVLRNYPNLAGQMGSYLQQAAARRSITQYYRPVAVDGEGRLYPDGYGAQQMPKAMRIALFGRTHVELDISGAHYEILRRISGNNNLPPIANLRSLLTDTLGPLLREDAHTDLIKRWPLIIINAATWEMAVRVIEKQLCMAMPSSVVHIASTLWHTAQRLDQCLPPWFAPRTGEWTTGRNFRLLESGEKTLTWFAYEFLQQSAPFTSVIWLHDGFWVSPPPSQFCLNCLHEAVCQRFQLDIGEAPLFRIKELRPLREALQRDLQKTPRLPIPGSKLLPPGQQTLPFPSIITKARVNLKTDQELVEEHSWRINKKKYTATNSKKRPWSMI